MGTKNPLDRPTLISIAVALLSVMVGIIAVPSVHEKLMELLDCDPKRGPKYSEKGVEYTELRDLLKKNDFEAANKETMNVLHSASGKSLDELLDIQDIKTFPCTDLNSINSFWEKYSDKRFGFSVQSRIWLQLGGSPGKYNPKHYEKFAESVGWKEAGKWKASTEPSFGYSKQQPTGHLPIIVHAKSPTLVPYLVERLQSCKAWK